MKESETQSEFASRNMTISTPTGANFEIFTDKGGRSRSKLSRERKQGQVGGGEGWYQIELRNLS